MIDPRGFYVVAQTPFADDGTLDETSIDSLCDFYIRGGVNGFTVLGVSGEAFRLTVSESLAVAKRYVARREGRPVIVGTSNASIAHLVEMSQRVMDLGAEGVMIAPAAGLKTEADLKNYFDQVMGGLGDIPVVLQDFPSSTGVNMSVASMVQLVADHPTICAIKHEDAPSLPKLSRLIDAMTRTVPILTGSNAQYLPEELRRGATGPMAGFSFPEVLARIEELHRKGDEDGVDEIFATFLPLIRHEAQGVWGLAVRKEIMRRRGAMASAFMRAPAPRLDARDMEEIDRLLTMLARRTDMVSTDLVGLGHA
ncbi:dihydrodipicolinate synthase family protein [Oceaniglobus trochenteri]|uniref:dihydrodipicolinate synthase family protein n=1 Tax=Oceaniglobus trochenteri TaxID=2763260 RepID=UPI001CFF92BE|nr:dihydrodipicolinate synthase family protein [Oceaniglobus trochenteri]